MSKKIFVIACLVMMATAFSGCDLLGGDKGQETAKESETEQNKENNNKDNNEEESFFGSMQDLLARGKSVKCTYKNVGGEDGEATGVFYVAGDKMRSEMDIIEKETGKEMEVNSIIIGDWMYTWNNFLPEGTKMNMKEMQDETSENYSQDETNKMKEEVDYKCRPWIPDDSKFIVPTDVEFRDMTEMMKGFQETMQNFNMDEIQGNAEKASAKLCAICEMLTGEARNKCRADAGCE